MKTILILFFVSTLFTPFLSQASVTLLEQGEWKISTYGFLEMDAFRDSRRSFTEVIGNNPVDRPGTVAGSTGRMQFSIRNTRLGFVFEAPPVDEWKTKGLLEFDLLGYDPSPGTTNTETGFFNNPSLRIRHAFLNAEKDGWQFLAGQTWALFGWQPYYFIPSVDVAPLPAMLYSRTAQFRAVKSITVAPDTTFQIALGLMRPPERDAALPGFEGGLRFATDQRSGGFTGGAGAHKTQPASIAFSSTVRDIVIPQNINNPTGETIHFTGQGYAVNALVPLLAAQDLKHQKDDPSHTVTFGGEFTRGTGYGDQFSSWTGNQPNPLNTGAAPYANVNMDAGIGGFDSSGNFKLIDMQTYNLFIQYHLPAQTRTWLSGGYGDLKANTSFTPAAGKVAYNHESVFFGNIYHDVTSQIRVALEYAHVGTDYVDAVVAHDNRYLFTAWFIF